MVESTHASLIHPLITSTDCISADTPATAAAEPAARALLWATHTRRIAFRTTSALGFKMLVEVPGKLLFLQTDLYCCEESLIVGFAVMRTVARLSTLRSMTRLLELRMGVGERILRMVLLFRVRGRFVLEQEGRI